MENVLMALSFEYVGQIRSLFCPWHPGAGQTDRKPLANLVANSWLYVSEICELLHIQSMGLTTTHTLTSTAGSMHVRRATFFALTVICVQLAATTQHAESLTVSMTWNFCSMPLSASQPPCWLLITSWVRVNRVSALWTPYQKILKTCKFIAVLSINCNGFSGWGFNDKRAELSNGFTTACFAIT